MGETRINELNIRGTVKEPTKEDSASGSGLTTAEKERLIEECISRIKAYLKYERER